MTNTTVVFYLGAPSTDFNQLTWSLRKDSVLLREQGVLASRPKVYRAVISDRLMTQQLGELSDRDREQLLKKLCLGEERSRLILADSSFLDEPQNMLRENRLYANASRSTQELRMLFPDHPVEFMLAIRNPVSLISEVADRLDSAEFTKVANEMDFFQPKWSEVVSEIREANPDSTINIWCYEDSPILWPEILRTTAGLPAAVPLSGELDLCATLLGDLALTRLRRFLAARPGLQPREKRHIMSAFLEKFADQEQVDQDISLAGVDSELLDEVSNCYFRDFESCKKIPGIVALG